MFFEIISIFILVSITNYWMVIPIGVLLVASYYLKNVYLTFSRSLRGLEAVSKYLGLKYSLLSSYGFTKVLYVFL